MQQDSIRPSAAEPSESLILFYDDLSALEANCPWILQMKLCEKVNFTENLASRFVRSNFNFQNEIWWVGHCESLKVLSSLMSSAPSFSEKRFLLVEDFSKSLLGFLSRDKFSKVLSWRDLQSGENFSKILEIQSARGTPLRAEHVENKRKASQSLIEGQKSLTEMVDDRTYSLQLVRRNSEEKSKSARSLFRFIYELGAVHASEEILSLLFSQAKTDFRILQIAFAFVDFSTKVRFEVLTDKYKFANQDLSSAPELSKVIRLNKEADLHWFANAVSMPVQRLIVIPLRRAGLNRQDQGTTLLFVHHGVSDAKQNEVVDFFAARAQAIEVALDKLLGEQEAREEARIWEKTFSGLNLPIVILDEDFEIVRANRFFYQDLIPTKGSEEIEQWKRRLTAGAPPFQIKVNEKYYEVHPFQITQTSEDGHFHYLVYFYDLTRSKELRKEIVQNEKMVALGHLAGHIAHELNNPLTGILSFCEILQQELEVETMKSDVAEIEQACRRCQKIIIDLMEFSKGDLSQIRPEKVHLNQLVEKTLSLVKTLTSEFERRIEFLEEDAEVSVDQSLFQQVLLNLIQNACQAMKKGGRLSIILTKSFEKIELRVSDTGEGVPAEIREKIFEPFFTTKVGRDGTGLGLSLSKRVIESFAGELSLECSEHHMGSTFLVVLPLTKEKK